MIRTEVSHSIPIDLIIEILSRLPVKSILRFRCVSKLWRFMLLRPYFTELFLTRSSARPPRMLFAVFKDCCFFTSPQPQNPYEEKSLSSLVVSADFHTKFPVHTWPEFCDLVFAGLIYFRPTCSFEKEAAICNPSTVQYASLRLPFHYVSLKRLRSKSFLGFDPIDKQFKVLYLSLPFSEKHEPDEILTLGTGNDSWREIHCPLSNSPTGEGICINGVLYYFGLRFGSPSVIVCFDVRSETFKFIHKNFLSLHYFSKLINYKGKLGVITLDNTTSLIKLCMYVIEDVEKPESSEWSECFCYCWEDDKVVDYKYLTIVGVTAATGEIVLSMQQAFKSFSVFFLNIERSTLQRVEIQGFGDSGSKVKVFLDYVEDLNFINMKTKYDATTTSTSSEAHVQQDRFEIINKFDSLRLF